jgi:hypothetical protein
VHIKMKDIYGTEVEIQESCSGYFRMDFKGRSFHEEDDGLGNKIPCCVSFDVDKARVIQAALNEYFEEN